MDIKTLTLVEKIEVKVLSLPSELRTLGNCFIVLIAIFFSIGAIFSAFVGFLKLLGIIQIVLQFNTSEDVIRDFIVLAEYFLVSVTFFAISMGLAHFSYSNPREAGIKKWANISELERYIFGMVIATIAMIFLDGILTVMSRFSVNNNISIFDSADIVFKVGIAIAAVIISLGLYLMFSIKKENDTKE